MTTSPFNPLTPIPQRVLVVDDVETNLLVAEAFFSAYGFTVDLAESGAEAIVKIEAGERYDGIFMDIQMPDIDGIETTAAIRALGYRGRVIALTADDADFTADGFDGHATKPLTADAIRVFTKTDAKPTRREGPRISPALAASFIRDAEKAVDVLRPLSELKNALSDEDFRTYIIHIHGIKSALYNVHQRRLADTAASLERAGYNRDMDLIQSTTPPLLTALENLVAELEIIATQSPTLDELETPIAQNSGKNIIFVVDDNESNLVMVHETLSAAYEVHALRSSPKLLTTLETLIPSLILLDVQMPEMNGYEVMRHIMSDSRYSKIPVIFLTGLDDAEIELQGLELGAVDYIRKPFVPSLLRKRIELQLELTRHRYHLETMVAEKIHEVEALKNAVIKTCAEMVEFRDGVTGGHIERTQQYVQLIIPAMHKYGAYTSQLASYNWELAAQSAQLHDVGKIAVRDDVLRKPGALEPEEFLEMKKHATAGEQIILKMKSKLDDSLFLEYARQFAISHHEKWNGMGYPYGLQGEDIPLLGRIMAIADVYDALVTVRPYKKSFTHEEAVGIIVKDRGTHFDPVLVDVFMMIHPEFERVAKENAS